MLHSIISFQAAESLNSECFDSHSFVLALNVPVSVTLREAIIECSNDSEMRQGTLSSVPFKLRLVDAYTGKLKEVSISDWRRCRSSIIATESFFHSRLLDCIQVWVQT